MKEANEITKPRKLRKNACRRSWSLEVDSAAKLSERRLHSEERASSAERRRSSCVSSALIVLQLVHSSVWTRWERSTGGSAHGLGKVETSERGVM